MKPVSTIVGQRIATRVSRDDGAVLAGSERNVCLDCLDAMPREERAAIVYVRELRSYDETRHDCAACGEQITGPVTGLSFESSN